MVVSPSFSMSATFQLNAIGRGFALIDIVGTINKMFRGFGKKKKKIPNLWIYFKNPKVIDSVEPSNPLSTMAKAQSSFKICFVW